MASANYNTYILVTKLRMNRIDHYLKKSGLQIQSYKFPRTHLDPVTYYQLVLKGNGVKYDGSKVYEIQLIQVPTLALPDNAVIIPVQYLKDYKAYFTMYGVDPVDYPEGTYVPYRP